MTKQRNRLATVTIAAACGLPACGGEVEDAVTRAPAALTTPTYHVGIWIYQTEAGFDLSAFTSEIATANQVWAPAGIQFDFNASTDVKTGGPATCADAPTFGNGIVGKIPIFFCPSEGGGDSSGDANYIRWSIGNSLAHELGHYFHLNHIFPGGVDPEDADVPPGSGRISAESVIRQQVEALCGGSCSVITPTLFQEGFQFRDALMNADGLDDTGLAWEAPPIARTGLDQCVPNYYVSLRVHFSSGQVFDYGFQPVKDNVMGYLWNCVPLTLSPKQVAIAQQALLAGNRSHLISKPLAVWNGAYSDANGWNLVQNYSTIRFTDIDGNGIADVCGRGSGGIWCGLSIASGSVNRSFSGPTLWNGSFSDGNGWSLPQYYRTIGFADFDGTGGADVCGRGSGGIWCGLSNGTSFSGPTLWTPGFADAGGWDQEVNYSTLRYPDVDGNHKADVCARHTTGVYCATSTGSSFNGAMVWSTDLNDPSFNQPQYYSTVRFPNVSGFDTGNVERADMCARGSAGVYCALWTASYNDADGFTDPKYYQTLGFPDLNNDHKADVCARGWDGVYCALSTGSSFGPVSRWTTGFSDAAGFDQPQFYGTLSYPDINNDGRSDVCARGPFGMYCATSTGSAFTDFHVYTTDVAAGTEWDQPADYTTLSFQEIDGDAPAELCGRSSAGIVCEKQ
jgi:hypothetical protein